MPEIIFTSLSTRPYSDHGLNYEWNGKAVYTPLETDAEAAFQVIEPVSLDEQKKIIDEFLDVSFQIKQIFQKITDIRSKFHKSGREE